MSHHPSQFVISLKINPWNKFPQAIEDGGREPNYCWVLPLTNLIPLLVHIHTREGNKLSIWVLNKSSPLLLFPYISGCVCVCAAAAAAATNNLICLPRKEEGGKGWLVGCVWVFYMLRRRLSLPRGRGGSPRAMNIDGSGGQINAAAGGGMRTGGKYKHG